MAKRDDSKKPKISKSKNAPKSVEFNLDGNVDKSVIVVVYKANVNYYAAVSANTKQNDPDYWNLKHPYPMPPNFTGRIEERAMLTQWLDGDSENRLFILRALGGFGKSALAWQWLTHDVNPKTWKKVVFWSFYEGDASFEHFVEETLKYLKLEVSSSKRDQVDTLLHAMQADNILLIMDGFERALRAYNNMNAAYQGDEESKLDNNQLDCVDINAEWFLKGVCALPNMNSKVLIATRLTPRVVMVGATLESHLQGCCEVELTAIQKADAVEFFHKQGIKGYRAEIESACIAYGYHPLSLRILTCLILNDRESPGNIAITERLNITDDIIQNKNHVLKAAFNNLTIDQQKLLGNISCFRSAPNYQAIKLISGIPSRRRKNASHNKKNNLDENLKKLETSGLLSWNRTNNNYYLHPIVRRFVYEHLNINERISTHTHLQSYFLSIKKPKHIENLHDLSSMIELYYHTVRAGSLDTAYELFYESFGKDLHFHFGAYELEIGLLRELTKENNVGSLTKDGYRRFVFAQLASAYTLSGQPHRAAELYNKVILLHSHETSEENLGIILTNLAGLAQIPTGAFHSAETNLKRGLNIGKAINNKTQEAICHQDLGLLSAYLGKWEKGEEELTYAMKHFDSLGIEDTNFVSVVRAHFSHLYILNRNLDKAVEFAKEALNLAQHPNRSRFSGERDIIHSGWLLGTAYCLNSQLDIGEHFLNDAIKRARTINLVSDEANIILSLAQLRYVQKNIDEAKSLADEALTITERCGYVLQGADVNLFLAQYALEQEKDNAKAKEYALEAKKLATCDGPPYYYKVAYDEAVKMLEGLNV